MSDFYDSTEYPDLLVPPFWGITERLPLLPERVTPNLELQQTLEPAILYAYLPVLTLEDSIIFMDAHNPLVESFTLTLPQSMNKVVERFRPEGDVAAIVAVTLGNAPTSTPEAVLESAKKELFRAAAQEIRRGLQLEARRGELIGFDLLCIDQATTELVVDYLALGDRLDSQFEMKACSETTMLGLFVHNSVVA